MIQYPAGHQRNSNLKRTNLKRTTINYGGRGMSLEEKVNQSNEYYLSRNIAVIHKKPTPVQIVNVDYPHRSAAKITEAYFRQASTTDYNGVYRGKYIDFEVKETQNKTRFPLQNIPPHQIEHMRKCAEHGGIAFFLISFNYHQKTYLFNIRALDKFMEQSEAKSIPYEFIQTHGFICPEGFMPSLDYLSALDKWILANDQKGSQE